MNRLSGAARSGFSRGLIEFRHMFTTTQDLVAFLLPTVIFMVAMAFLRAVPTGAAGLSIGTLMVTSVLGSNVCFSGLLTVSQALSTEREDGTLLRAKAVPNGMLSYLIGKIVFISGATLVSLVITLTYALVVFDEVTVPGPLGWLKLAAVLVFGLFATMPLGAVLGSVFSSPRMTGFISMPIMGLMAVSGILYPITILPVWVQWIAQAFPMYWLGLGMRSALLPDSALAVEIGQSWRGWETFGVLGLWAVIGLALAPAVLRRMARRESGSSVAARREKAMQRIG
ncbi:ABC transporter permease [Kutzneria chonburiensis]|uniref:ABC transporter permease n=1 Tax=Kutzneria chonburiensis TaxID=1483604 RepID=A0ABV6MIM7_9PSEU|nr:ABC transporter permease [Kutzneria chonburiensis]